MGGNESFAREAGKEIFRYPCRGKQATRWMLYDASEMHAQSLAFQKLQSTPAIHMHARTHKRRTEQAAGQELTNSFRTAESSLERRERSSSASAPVMYGKSARKSLGDRQPLEWDNEV